LRFIAFESDAFTLIPNDTDGLPDVFVLDTCIGAAAGCTNRLTRLSVTAAGVQAGGQSPAISRDGHFIAFVTCQQSCVLPQSPFITVIPNPLIP
jgi:hypothetical protein